VIAASCCPEGTGCDGLSSIGVPKRAASDAPALVASEIVDHSAEADDRSGANRSGGVGTGEALLPEVIWAGSAGKTAVEEGIG
jgi:hypothetical protein